MARNRPNATLAYRYGPPASRNCDATSAMHAAMIEIPANATRNPRGLHFPRRAAISAGKPKMLAPIMVLTISAARLQRPMVRTSPFGDSFKGASIGSQICRKDFASLSKEAAPALHDSLALREFVKR